MNTKRINIKLSKADSLRLQEIAHDTDISASKVIKKWLTDLDSISINISVNRKVIKEVSYTLRLKLDLLEELEAKATALGLPLSYLIRLAIINRIQQAPSKPTTLSKAALGSSEIATKNAVEYSNLLRFSGKYNDSLEALRKHFSTISLQKLIQAGYAAVTIGDFGIYDEVEGYIKDRFKPHEADEMRNLELLYLHKSVEAKESGVAKQLLTKLEDQDFGSESSLMGYYYMNAAAYEKLQGRLLISETLYEKALGYFSLPENILEILRIKTKLTSLYQLGNKKEKLAGSFSEIDKLLSLTKNSLYKAEYLKEKSVFAYIYENGFQYDKLSAESLKFGKESGSMKLQLRQLYDMMGIAMENEKWEALSQYISEAQKLENVVYPGQTITLSYLYQIFLVAKADLGQGLLLIEDAFKSNDYFDRRRLKYMKSGAKYLFGSDDVKENGVKELEKLARESQQKSLRTAAQKVLVFNKLVFLR